MVRIRAPELPQDFSWVNCIHPLSLRALRGRIVILDFWTYGCINCLHVIPDLNYLEQTYADHLTVIGVHTAKFTQEQDPDSIQQAIERYGMGHPVVVDRDRQVWEAYTVRAYPTFVVIDPQGYVVATLSGEGQRQRLDALIQQLQIEHTGSGTLDDAAIQQILPSPPLLLSSLAFPGKVLADESSNTLFIADTGHDRVVIATFTGEVIGIVGTGIAGAQDGDWETAQFSAPQGMVLDPQQQRLYVADTGNHLLRYVDLVQRQVVTLAGTGIQSRSWFPHGGKALEVDLNSPWDLALVGEILYVAMAGMHQIWAMDLTQATLQTFMGTGAEFCVDGPVEVAAFAQPSGLATDGQTLFVADSETSSIRAIELQSVAQVRTVCGSGQLFEFGDRDGVGSQVRLQHCLGITYANSHLWVADTYNHKIKRIHPATGACKTIDPAETVTSQNAADSATRFAEPAGLSYANHRLYIADTNHHRICQIDLSSLDVAPLTFPTLCSPSVCLPT